MIAHVVLFRPRRDLSSGDRETLVSTFSTALQAIPSIRRARVGRRITHGRPGYEQLMRIDFPYAAVIEFDDTAGLTAYLAHPAHEQLGEQFFAVFEEALMYDFEMADGEDGLLKLL